MKNIYISKETAKKLLEALGIREDEPKLAPKLADPPVVIVIEAINIYPGLADEGCDADYDDEDEDVYDDDEEEACPDFEADKIGRCIHLCPECGKCMLEE